MIKLSNQDARILRRLLGVAQGVAGNDAQTKNIRRQANMLAKKIDKKIEDNGKARIKLL